MKKQPRQYQLDAYKSLISDVAAGRRPYVSMSTASGKSIVVAMLAEKALKQNGRALVLVPFSELVTQNYEEHFNYTDNKRALGMCSAKLGRFDINARAVYATYTSFLRRRTKSGVFNILIIDEAHYLSNDETTSYQKIIRSLLRLNPNMKIVGLTATPYRHGQGYLHQDCVKGKATFTNCAYETDISRLINEGYLSHVESISGDVEIDLDGVKVKQSGEYDDRQVGVKFDAIVKNAVADMRVKFNAYGINTALIYASNLDSARHIINEWDNPETMRLAWGDMTNHDRNELVKWMREGKGKRYVVNVGLFVVGFNYPKLDCIVLMTATNSLVKYVQICGRVIRAHKDKEQGYVLDYGTNIERHGAIDQTIAPKNVKKRGDAPKKLCLMDGCGFPNLLSAKHCKECGAEFIPTDDESGKYSMRSKAEILAAKMEETHTIESVEYIIAWSNSNGKKMIKQKFYNEYFDCVHENYLCLNHDNYAADKAHRFLAQLFKNTSDYYKLGKAGRTLENIFMLLTEHPQFFKTIVEITIKKGEGKYYELKRVKYA